MLHVLAMLLDAVVEQLLASLREEIATFSHLSTKTIIPLQTEDLSYTWHHYNYFILHLLSHCFAQSLYLLTIV